MPSTVTIDDTGACLCPCFYLREGAIWGTYIRDTDSIATFSTDHGRTWPMFTLPEQYDLLTSQEHKGRLVCIGWREADEAWFVIVGKIGRNSGTDLVEITWGTEAELTEAVDATSEGHLREAADGDLNFAYLDTNGDWIILTCRDLAASNAAGEWF